MGSNTEYDIPLEDDEELEQALALSREQEQVEKKTRRGDYCWKRKML